MNRLKSRAHGNFGLSVANIARQQTVHGHRLFHIRLDLVDGDQLIGSLDVGEGIFQFALPGGIWAEGMTFRRLTDGVQADKLLRDFLDGFARLSFCFLPVGTAHLGQCGLIRSGVFRDLIQAICGDEETVSGLAAFRRRVFQDQVVPGHLAITATNGSGHQFNEAPNAMLVMDDVVARMQAERVNALASPRGHLAHIASRSANSPRKIRFRDDRQFQIRRDKALCAGSRHNIKNR